MPARVSCDEKIAMYIKHQRRVCKLVLITKGMLIRCQSGSLLMEYRRPPYIAEDSVGGVSLEVIWTLEEDCIDSHTTLTSPGEESVLSSPPSQPTHQPADS